MYDTSSCWFSKEGNSNDTWKFVVRAISGNRKFNHPFLVTKEIASPQSTISVYSIQQNMTERLLNRNFMIFHQLRNIQRIFLKPHKYLLCLKQQNWKTFKELVFWSKMEECNIFYSILSILLKKHRLLGKNGLSSCGSCEVEVLVNFGLMEKE